MKKIYTLFAALVWSAGLYSQGCVGSFTLTTQTQVDAFACTSTTGNLIIESAAIDPILNLDGLAGLTHVGGSLIIRDNALLTDFDGLNMLQTIGGNLLFEANPFLLHLDDFLSIIAVGGNLTIVDNPLLIDVNGLINLSNFDGNLSIQRNDILQNIDGLLSLNGLIGAVTIADNPLLSDILGLFGITQLTGALNIRFLPLITDLTGLDNITSVGGSVLIQQLATLDNLDALAGLTTIGGGLTIRNNNALLDATALGALTSLGGGLTFLNNLNLANNAIDLSGLTGPLNGDLQIINNDAMINIDFLSGITAVNGNLVIRNNNLIFNIDGITNITDISGGLEITGNPNLLDCTGSCTAINNMGVVGALIVSGNAGCPDAPTLEAVCLVLPIELAYFRGEAQDDRIVLSWLTLTESNNSGFEIQRSENGRDYKTIHWAEGLGTSTSSQYYSYTDTEVEKGINYFYRLYQLDFDGTGTYSNWIAVQLPVAQVQVEEFFPNPAHSTTACYINSPSDDIVNIEIIAANGVVQRQDQQYITAGRQMIELDCSGLAAGFYLVRITLNNISFNTKLSISNPN
ncbi:MAG: T9SS type A sorting domain-containing protein [Saprospiraceae bacterium]|nr:T9SS type A sorting domain-containing protein [Saprospiraceae bacterium]